MRNLSLHLLAAGLALALAGCNGEPEPPLKKSAPASQPPPAAKPPAPMTTKPATTPAKPTTPPATPTQPTPSPTAKSATTEPVKPAATPATTEPIGVTPAPSATEPMAGEPGLPTTEPLAGAPPTPPTEPVTPSPQADDELPPADPGAAALPRGAIARVTATSGNQASGTVTFTSTGTGVKVQVSLTGLTPGEHAIHIHEKGDCSAPDAASAGEHFSTKPAPHAGPLDVARHTGDLGNVTADEQGRVETSFIDEQISLLGEESIVQRSIIVHAGRDDFTTQPAGNSGAPVGCGVIEAQP